MRETLRFAREYGASKADQILFGRISAKSGLAIHLTDKVPGGRDGRSAIKYPKFTESDIKANMAYIAGMESVKDIPAEKLQRTGKRPKELFTEYFESLGNSIYSPVFGDISLGKSSIKSEIRHGSTAEKIACIEAIPDVIEKGKVIFFENKIGSDNRVKRIVIAAPIQIAGKPYYMGVMLQRDPSTQYLYLHNVAIEKEMDPSSRAHLVTTGADEQSSHLSMTSILQNAINVKLIGDKILESYSEVLDNLSKSQAISLIQRGITGDDLLNAGDLAAEILSVGGEITEDGKAVLYHGTSKENAEKINSTGKMYGKEDGLFFSTKSDGLVLDYGKAVVKVEIPLEKLILDDIFDSEVHLRMPVKQYQLTDVRFAVEGSGNVAFFDGKNTIYLDANAPRVRSYKGLLGHEVWHKMFKSSRITNLFNSALDKIDPGVRAEVKETYIQHLRELGGFTETEIETVSDEEVAAAYAEELFNEPHVWDIVLDGEPTLKDKVLAFFKLAPKKYSFAPEMDPAAKEWITEYKKLFDEISAENRSESAVEVIGRITEDGESQSVKVIGRVTEDNITTTDGSYAAENADSDGVTSINQQKMQVSDGRFALYSDKVKQTISKAISTKGELGTDYNQEPISEVPDKIALMVKAASDGRIDISNKRIALNGSDIWHEYKRHSDEYNEIGRRQIPLSIETMRDAIMAIYDPDVVETLYYTTDNPKQRQSFAYAKKTSNGHYVVAEVVGGKQNPNITPAMIVEFSQIKWEEMISAGKTLGEILYEAQPKMINSLDVAFNIKNRVTAAQFASNEAIANTPHSPRFKDSISQNSQNDKGSDKNTSKNVDSGGRSALNTGKKVDRATVKLKAEYKTDRVFSQAEVDRAFREVEALESLPRGMKKSLSEEIFVRMNESLNEGERSLLRLEYGVKIKDAIMQNEKGKYFGAGVLQETKLREEIDNMLRSISEAGRESKRSKMAEEVRGEVKVEEAKTRRVLAKIYSSLKRIDDQKRHRFAAASAYKGEMLGGAVEALTIRFLDAWYSFRVM